MPWPSVDQKRRSERKTFKEATEEGQYLGHNNLWQWPLLVLIYKELSGMVRREGRAPCMGPMSPVPVQPRWAGLYPLKLTNLKLNKVHLETKRPF